MGESNFQSRWELLVADTWDDSELRERLLDDPVAVLKERGIRVPDGLEVKILADTDSVEHLVLPAGPYEEEISTEALEAVVGGGCRACRGCRGCRGCFSCRGCRGCRSSRGCRP